MERINQRVVAGLKVLNRSLAEQIIDTQELYNGPSRAEMIHSKILAQVRERNKKYLEQRKKKLLQQVEFENSKWQHSDSKDEQSNITVTLSTKEMQIYTEPSTNLLNQSHSTALNQSQLVVDRDTLTKSITDRGQFSNSEISLLPTVRGPVRPKLILPELKYSLGDGRSDSKINRVETSNKFRQSLAKSTKSTAHTSLVLSSQRLSVRDRDSSPVLSDRIVPKSLSLPKFAKGEEEVQISRPPRSLLVSNKIIQYMMESCKDLGISAQYKGIISDTELIANRKYMLEFYNTNVEMLNISISKLELAMKSLKMRAMFEHHISEFVNAALNSHNVEFHIEALKLQGKIHMKYHDYSRAVLAFKLIKRVANNNLDTSPDNLLSEGNRHYFRQKQIAYKQLSKCFQEIQNYKIAIFYLMKMLQIAWFLKNTNDEVYIYDTLGIQYYYLGNLQMSEYYHDRAMKGMLEPPTSEIRKIGVQKLLSQLLDKNNESAMKHKNIKTIEEEIHGEEYPDSEDEFEMPEHHQVIDSMKNQLKQMKADAAANQRKKLVNYPLLQLEQQRKLRRKIKRKYLGQLLVEQQTEEDIKRKLEHIGRIAELEADVHPPKPPILINHLSSSRRNRMSGVNFLETPEAPSKKLLFKKANIDVFQKQVEEKLKERIDELRKNIIIACDRAQQLVEVLETNTTKVRRKRNLTTIS